MPVQITACGAQPLADVGLPFGCRMRQRVVGCSQATGQRLQVLKRVAYVLFHLGVGCLVHQRKQACADVIVQVLGDAGTLFAATLFDRPVVSHCASQLLEQALAELCVGLGEQTLALVREAQDQAARCGGRHIAG